MARALAPEDIFRHMKLNFNAQQEVNDEDLSLLCFNIPNEILNGFRVDRFEEQIGSTEDDFRKMAKRWRSKSNSELPFLDIAEIEVFRNALAITVLELGDDEFQTRTGCDFERGKNMLQVLDRYIADCSQS
jgi:hypothetical protein